MGAVIGCDVGSQSLKGVLLGAGGGILAEAAAPYDLSFPHPNWAEQDPGDWLSALGTVVAKLLAGANVEAAQVGTLGLATQVDGVVAVGAGGDALRPAIIWMDRRAEAQSTALGERMPAEIIFDLTGLNLDSSHVAPKILWLRDEEPHIYEKAEAFLLPGSYLVHRLTGEKVVDYSNASSSMLYDVREKDWSEKMLAAAALDAGLLGRVAPAQEVAGTLTPAAAREVGLAAGTKVVVGCGDEHGACLGAGLVEPDLVCDITGTAEPVAVAADAPVFDETGLVETHAHADPRLWLIENPGFVSGGSIRWYSDNVARTDYREMTAEAEAVPPGSEDLVFLPCLSGAMTPTWNGNARGVFYGLSMKHGRGHMTRAVFEGCAYGFRDIVERFEAMGVGGEEVRVVGGGAKSPFWCQIKADATGRTLRALKNQEATATGAAMLAGVAEGVYASLDEAAGRLLEFGASYEPDPKNKAAYDEAYGLYRATYAALEPVFDRGALVKVVRELAGADPTDLEGLRASLRAADPEARLAPIGVSRIEIGDGALELLPEAVAGISRGPDVVLVTDATPMRRGEEDLKERAARSLAGRFEVRRAVIGARRAALHADEAALAEAEAAVEGADCVVVVGSGTITDVCKEATARVGGSPLLVVQTAASVNAFSDDVAVLLKAGAKRTVPSRWPDVLLIDLRVLAGAPPAMNLAGFGDLISLWTAPADWYLASAVGMDDSYHPAPIEMLREGGRALLDAAASLRRRDPAALDKLARVLTLSGISLGVAGKTAPLSGTEHLVSHLVDMAAEQLDSPLAFHGAQVAVAAIPVAAAWQTLLEQFDPSTVDPDRLFPGEEALEPVVREAFASMDPSGRVGEECWSDYRKKLAAWRAARPRVEEFLRDWAIHRARLKEMVLPPERLADALKEAGAPTRFSELDPPVTPRVSRWALRNCHLMRNRFTAADLLFFAGLWDESFVEVLLARARESGGGL